MTAAPDIRPPAPTAGSEEEDMQQWHRGWRVCVADSGGKYASVYAPRAGAVSYAPGTVTWPRPGCGPLTVFRWRNHAEEFLGREGGRLRLLACAYLPSRSRDDTARAQPALWAGDEMMTPAELPTGTALADAVALWPAA